MIYLISFNNSTHLAFIIGFSKLIIIDAIVGKNLESYAYSYNNKLFLKMMLITSNIFVI